MLTLRDYQHVGVDWLRARDKRILADDVGLGKTAQALVALTTPALIVTPPHLTYQWFNAACDQLPKATVSLPEGTRLQRQLELRRRADITIINYEMLRGQGFELPPYNTLIVEEAHRVRNRNADQSRAIRAISQQTANTYLLTASPYYKGTHDIWNLLRIVGAQDTSSYWDFLRKWFAVNWGHPYTPKIYGIKPKLITQWREYVSNYMLMRTYEDVGRELPPLIEKQVIVQLPPDIQRIYDDVHLRYKLAGMPIESAGAVTATLRALTMNHVKQEAVASIVANIPNNEPALVYVWYRESADLVSARLTAAKVQHVKLTGETPPKTRALVLDKAIRLGYSVVATQSSLSEGANLQHMRHVVYAEESYVPEEHRQTLARVRRDRGNDVGAQAATKPVIAYYVRARRTIDEAIPRARGRGAKSIQDVIRVM